MRMKIVNVFSGTSALLLLLTGFTLHAGKNVPIDDAAVVKAPIKKLALFKNGLGAVVREIDFPNAGCYFLTDSISPLHGTIWFTAPEKMTAQTVQRIFMAPNPGNTADPALTYQGQEVQIEYSTGSGIAGVTGTVLAAAPQTEQKENVQYTYAPYYRFSSYNNLPVPGVKSPWIDLKLKDGRVMSLRNDRIVSITAVKKAGKVPVLRNILQFNLPEKPAAPVLMSYLTKGISWAPAYRIELKDKDKMMLTMSAVITNDLEDLKDAEISLISGYPNIKLANVRSPLSGISLQQFFNELNSAENERRYSSRYTSNMMIQQAAAPQNGGGTGELMVYASNDSNDIQYRNAGKISMDKGGSLYMTLESAETDCERLVQWTIQNNIDENGCRIQNNQQKDGAADLWDCVRFRNPLKYAMTTAPIETVSGGKILGQSAGSWFNPGQSALVRITKALTVSGKFTEYEETAAGKPRDLIYRYGAAFREHTLTGVLELENHRDKPAKVLVKRRISGELVSADNSPAVDFLGGQAALCVNKRCELTWEITLQPKEKKTIKYQHKVLIRN